MRSSKREASFTFAFKDGGSRQFRREIGKGRLLLPRSEVPAGVESVDVMLDDFTASAGDGGYFVIPNSRATRRGDNNGHSALIRFRERPDMEAVFPDNIMPVYGVVHGDRGVLAVVSGMSLDFSLVARVEGGLYRLFPRFVLDGEIPYEDMEIKFFELSGKDANYSSLARRYRKHQLERGACQPIRERMKRYPVVGEAALGPEVRVRLAWKPVPPPVMEQTEENEPPMHVAISFERAGHILDEFHRQGVENAEFCLVGWNKSGHDGRWPDIFPVEPLLGGEPALKKLIDKAKSYGYLICPHTNAMDSYSIAKRFDKGDLVIQKDGSFETDPKWGWGGGQYYRQCPKASHEKFALEDFNAMRGLGFRGISYIDIMSILRPPACRNPAHPLNRREAGEWRGRTMALARESIGASGSEGSWDFCIGSLDYVLYAIFNPHAEMPPICDEAIPLWHLVYHGIVLYNSSCDAVNSAQKSRKEWLKNLEFGGRPLVYFYAKFLSSGSNWMGDIDCGCSTDEELRSCVSKVKKEFDEYKRVRRLQFEFIESHEKLADGVFLSRYSDGSVIGVNYNDVPYDWNGVEIPPCDFLLQEASECAN